MSDSCALCRPLKETSMSPWGASPSWDTVTV